MIGSRMWSFVAEAVWRARNRSKRLAQIQRATTPFGRWPRLANRRPMLGAVVFETRIEPTTTEGACVALPPQASTITAVRTRQHWGALLCRRGVSVAPRTRKTGWIGVGTPFATPVAGTQSNAMVLVQTSGPTRASAPKMPKPKAERPRVCDSVLSPVGGGRQISSCLLRPPC
jgi:hypothetical protein